MIEEMKKELQIVVTEASKKLIRLGSKLILFVIACWLFMGALAIGIVAPVSMFKVISSSKDVRQVRTAHTVPDLVQKTVRSEPTVSRISYNQPTPIQPSINIRRNIKQPDLRSEIRETRGVVSEMRRFGNGIADFVKV